MWVPPKVAHLAYMCTGFKPWNLTKNSLSTLDQWQAHGQELMMGSFTSFPYLVATSSFSDARTSETRHHPFLWWTSKALLLWHMCTNSLKERSEWRRLNGGRILRWSMLLLGVPSCPRTFLVRRLAVPKGVGGSRNEGRLCRSVVPDVPVYHLHCWRLRRYGLFNGFFILGILPIWSQIEVGIGKSLYDNKWPTLLGGSWTDTTVISMYCIKVLSSFSHCNSGSIIWKGGKNIQSCWGADRGWMAAELFPC